MLPVSIVGAGTEVGVPSAASRGTTGAYQPASGIGMKSGGVRPISIVTSIGRLPVVQFGSRYTTSALYPLPGIVRSIRARPAALEFAQ